MSFPSYSMITIGGIPTRCVTQAHIEHPDFDVSMPLVDIEFTEATARFGDVTLTGFMVEVDRHVVFSAAERPEWWPSKDNGDILDWKELSSAGRRLRIHHLRDFRRIAHNLSAGGAIGTGIKTTGSVDFAVPVGEEFRSLRDFTIAPQAGPVIITGGAAIPIPLRGGKLSASRKFTVVGDEVGFRSTGPRRLMFSTGLNVVLGSAGSGKSVLLAGLATHFENSGLTVGYHSIGEPVDQLDGLTTSELFATIYEGMIEKPVNVLIVDSLLPLTLEGSKLAEGGVARELVLSLVALDFAARAAGCTVIATINPLTSRGAEPIEAMVSASVTHIVVTLDAFPEYVHNSSGGPGSSQTTTETVVRVTCTSSLRPRLRTPDTFTLHVTAKD